MSSNQLYPFERNRYYPGKMLTSADFQAEQDYYVNKERFRNSLMYGAGILCGCAVFSLDDQSVLIESGVAIDGQGRELIIDSSVVKKLSAIDGFDDLKSDEAALCVRYKENEVHAVYSVSHNEDDKEYEYNRVSEGYEIFLLDGEEAEGEGDIDDGFLLSEDLVANDNFRARIIVPNTLCKGRNARIVLEVEKISSRDVSFTCDGILEIPGLLTPEKTGIIELGVMDLSLDEGEVFKKNYWVEVQDTSLSETNIILQSGSAHAFEDQIAVNVAQSFSMKVDLLDVTPIELINSKTSTTSLEMREIGGSAAYICLAKIRLVRTENSYIIDSIEEKFTKKFVPVPGQELLRSRYLEYFVKKVDIFEKESTERGSVTKSTGNTSPAKATDFASGTLEIPLGRNASAGDVRYSGEITHGLGKGNIYVSVGYEMIADDPTIGSSAKSTIFGNPMLFRNDSNPDVDAETAVRVLNDKGSFVVAAKLLRNVDYLVLTYRWVAVRFPAGDDMEVEEDYFDKSISADTPTVVMGTKENHYFGVRFNNMKKCSITYELTTAGSGEISSDGIYTSPAKEGVYEIRIYCTDMPVICTYAYAIVKKNQATNDTSDERMTGGAVADPAGKAVSKISEALNGTGGQDDGI